MTMLQVCNSAVSFCEEEWMAVDGKPRKDMLVIVGSCFVIHQNISRR